MITKKYTFLVLSLLLALVPSMQKASFLEYFTLRNTFRVTCFTLVSCVIGYFVYTHIKKQTRQKPPLVPTQDQRTARPATPPTPPALPRPVRAIPELTPFEHALYLLAQYHEERERREQHAELRTQIFALLRSHEDILDQQDGNNNTFLTCAAYFAQKDKDRSLINDLLKQGEQLRWHYRKNPSTSFDGKGGIRAEKLEEIHTAYQLIGILDSELGTEFTTDAMDSLKAENPHAIDSPLKTLEKVKTDIQTNIAAIKEKFLNIDAQKKRLARFAGRPASPTVNPIAQ